MSTTDKDFKVKNGLIVENGSATVSGNITATNGDVSGSYLRATNSVGDEGGEVLLAKPQTNSTIAGTGVTFDIFQNRIRFFEQGGSARGYYLDITDGGSGASTNLLSGGLQGTQGLTGSQGITGLQGTTGLQGNIGLQGTVGQTGSQGLTGSQGTTGNTGSQGITGSQGTTGNTGSQGITGTQGIQGIQGIIGDDGFVAQTSAPENTGLLWLDTDEPAEVSGVNQIIAGTNVTISPTGGTGVVTINASGGGGGAAGDSDQTIIPVQIFS